MPINHGELPFQQQIDYFTAKTPVPTARWNDLQREGHDTGFMVAGAVKADLLADLQAAIRKVMAEGGTLREFRKDFDKIVADRGWTGWTGSDTDAGIAWRTRVIYETNLRTAYQAGRWQQIQDGKQQRPYLMYRHSHAVLSPRVEHLAWDGLIVRIDSDWVKTHYPPNGYGCKCTMFALSDRDLQRFGKPLDPSIKSWTDPNTGKRYSLDPPDDGTYNWKDPKTGDWHTFQKGIQPFWDYAPGASLSARAAEAIARKIETLPPAISQQLSRYLAKAQIGDRPIDWHGKPTSSLKDIHAILADVATLRPDWLPHGVKSVNLAEVPGMLAATDSRGHFWLSSAEIPDTGGQSGLTLTQIALANIKAGKSLAFAEEYAIETLWHEIGHNRQAQIMVDLMPAGQRIIAESLRQTLARQTYPALLQAFGTDARHLVAIRDKGLSYSKSSGTLKKLLINIGAMDSQLTLPAGLLAELEAIDKQADWPNMLGQLVQTLSVRYPHHRGLIANTLNRLADANYDY